MIRFSVQGPRLAKQAGERYIINPPFSASAGGAFLVGPRSAARNPAALSSPQEGSGNIPFPPAVLQVGDSWPGLIDPYQQNHKSWFKLGKMQSKVPLVIFFNGSLLVYNPLDKISWS